MADKQDKTPEEITKERYAVIDGMKISAEEKETLRLYDQGIQNFEIARRVYKFVNNDTVGTVVHTIRRAHAEDFEETETINSYKGYTGV